MGERMFVNPSRIVLSDATPFFYPISNTPAIDLCEDIPPRDSCHPLAVCLLGAGDIRNVLYTTYKRRRRGDQRRFSFYVNDHNPAIVARDILLLTLAAQAPQGNHDRLLIEFVDFFIHAYADLFLANDTRNRIDIVLKDLINNFPAEGSAFTVFDPDQLWYVKRTWALWLIDQQKVRDVENVRYAKSKTYFSIKYGLRDQVSRASSSDPAKDAFLGGMVSLEAMANSDLAATPRMREELSQYYKSGNITGRLASSRLNPTLFDPETKEFPHYSSNPFQPFATAAEAGDYSVDNQTLLAILKSSLKRLVSVFAQELNAGNVQVTFDVGDCNSFLSERLPANAAFDVIDTSNLTDNLGLINLLVLGIPRLNRDEPHSTLWTETLKAHNAYDSLDEFLLDALGFRYAVVSSILQTACIVPFESVYAFDDESGRNCRSATATGLLLKWKNPFSASNSALNNSLDLAPNPDACFFRQFVDTALSHIYDSYTGRVNDFTGGNRKRKAILPHEYTFTVSTVIHVLCQAAKMLKRPRQLFDYLYEKVKLRKQTQSVSEGQRIFSVFALDVQMTASLICPDKYKPLEPLHPLLSVAGYKTLETRAHALTHYSGRTNHPSPIVGWLLLDKYSPLDDVHLQTVPSGLLAKLVESLSTVGGVLKMALPKDLFSYILENVQRLQIIDSVSVSFPDKEVLLTLPSFLFASKHQYAIVGISTLDGTVLYSPIADTAMAAATIISQQRQTLEYVSPGVAQLSSEFDDSQRVSVLREYHDRFDGIIESESPLNPTWKLTGEKVGPLEVRLCIGPTPTIQSAVVESKHVSMCLPTVVDVNSSPRLLEFVDERRVKFSLHKSRNTLHPRQEELDLSSLEKWPVNKPLGVSFSMFTAAEISASVSSRPAGGLPFGHDAYLDTRKTILTMYNAFIDQNMRMSRQIIKLCEDGKKLFHTVSSLEIGFLALTPQIKATPLGTPVIELHYLDSTDPPPPEVDQLLEYIHSPQRFDDHKVVTTRGTDEEIEIILDLLQRNARLLKDEAPPYVGGVCMKRSFVIPIYSKENRVGDRHPEQSRSAYMDKLDQWRKQQGIPPWFTDGPPIQSSWSYNPVATEEAVVACFTCSSRRSELKRCGRCQSVWFCNKQCQEEGWQRHKQHCKPGRDAK